MSRERDCVKIDDYCFFNGTKSIHVIHSPEELYIISFLVFGGWLVNRRLLIDDEILKSVCAC